MTPARERERERQKKRNLCTYNLSLFHLQGFFQCLQTLTAQCLNCFFSVLVEIVFSPLFSQLFLWLTDRLKRPRKRERKQASQELIVIVEYYHSLIVLAYFHVRHLFLLLISCRCVSSSVIQYFSTVFFLLLCVCFLSASTIVITRKCQTQMHTRKQGGNKSSPFNNKDIMLLILHTVKAFIVSVYFFFSPKLSCVQ